MKKIKAHTKRHSSKKSARKSRLIKDLLLSAVVLVLGVIAAELMVRPMVVEADASTTPPTIETFPTADYTKVTGLTADATKGITHTFAKPCVVDIDKDGLLDIIWSNHYHQSWDVYLGLPNGTWAEDVRTTWGWTDDNHSCAVADFDGDSDLDLFASIGACEGTCFHLEEMWMQNGDGPFTDVASTYIQPASTKNRSRQAVPIDANNDGKMDLFVPADSSTVSRNRLLFNDGTALVAKTAGLEPNGGRTMCALAHDLDGDGWTDIIVCRAKAVDLWRNNGDNTFSKKAFGIAPMPVARSITMSDIDQDGAADMVLVTKTALQVRLNRGGTYSQVDWTMPISDGIDVVTPDFDGDGRLDIYVLQLPSNLNPSALGADFVLLNRGSPTNWSRVSIPQSPVGKGDSVAVLPNFWGSGKDAVLVSNGSWGNLGPRQVLAAAGLQQPVVASELSGMGDITIQVGTMFAELGASFDGKFAPTYTSYTVPTGSLHQLNAQPSIVRGSTTWKFYRWSDGGIQNHDIIAGKHDSTYTAIYRRVK